MEGNRMEKFSLLKVLKKGQMFTANLQINYWYRVEK